MASAVVCSVVGIGLMGGNFAVNADDQETHGLRAGVPQTVAMPVLRETKITGLHGERRSIQRHFTRSFQDVIEFLVPGVKMFPDAGSRFDHIVVDKLDTGVSPQVIAV